MSGGVRNAFGKGRKQRKQAEADAAAKAADISATPMATDSKDRGRQTPV